MAIGCIPGSGTRLVRLREAVRSLADVESVTDARAGAGNVARSLARRLPVPQARKP